MLDHYRSELARFMDATLADERTRQDWTYAAVRPLPVPATWHPGLRIRSDCSFGCKLLCKWSGILDDPTGDHYGGFGNSSTIAAHLKHVPHAAELEVGDIITFGTDGANEHAAMVREPGTDPLLWSDGHQGAPNLYRLSADGRPHIFCRLNVPPYNPTPDDKLRARTGYWSWLQWRLGEGHWHHKPPKDKHVRPNVPRVIPLAWWRAYTRFLLGRRKGNPARQARA